MARRPPGAVTAPSAATHPSTGTPQRRAAALEPGYAKLANFYLRRLLPRASARLAEIEAADAVLELLAAS